MLGPSSFCCFLEPVHSAKARPANLMPCRCCFAAGLCISDGAVASHIATMAEVAIELTRCNYTIPTAPACPVTQLLSPPNRPTSPAGAVGHGGHYHSQSLEAFFANQLTPSRQFPCRGGGARRPLPLPVARSLLHPHPGRQSGHAQRSPRGQRWADRSGFDGACT